MNYIVLDLKWNVSGGANRKKRELEQIGAVKVDEKLNIIDKFYADMRKGRDFAKVMEKFRLWCDDAPFVTWGRSDAGMLEEIMFEKGIDIDWIPQVFDAQEIFDDQVTMQGRQFALNYAVMKFGEKPLRGQNALTITLGIVKVLRNLSFARGIQMQQGNFAFETI